MLANFSWFEDHKIAGSGRPGGYWSEERQNWAKITEDLRLLFATGVRAVVSLTEMPLPQELVQAEGMEYCHLPVADMQPPRVEDVLAFIDFVGKAHDASQPVVVHCQAGLGRTGTMLACYKVRHGAGPQEAIEAVRRVRPGSVETAEQEAVVWEYAAYLESTNKQAIGS